MPQMTKKGSIIGAVGATLVGTAMLFFVVTIILNSLKDNAKPGPLGAGNDTKAIENRAIWNQTNESINQLLNFITISAILLGVLGITMIGASIIGYISGAFM